MLTKIKELRQQGFTTKEASKYLNIPVWKLKSLGWHKLPNPKENLTNTYKKNVDYFDNIDTINKAYILGFTLADGCIYSNGTLSYEIHKKDKEILDLIKSEISPDSKIKNINRVRNYKGYTWESNTIKLVIKCKKFYYDLDHWGIIPNKTYKKQFLPDIDKKFMSHFIRGYFDGDGSVWMHEGKRPYINFTGENNLLLEIADYLNCINIFSKIYKVRKVKNQNNSCLTICRKKDVKSFYNFIYEQGFYLKRKKEKFNYELA